MKNWNDEITKLSMADEDDYDEYEEEVIERDEEYDDEDYDDEEYEDEEYEDEDYGDEEYEDEEYEEEPYEEGYDDQYYDDRLNRVLDELAELKRGMTPPAVVPQQQQQPIQPQLLYTLPQQNSNEVVMYNEISRLRDELAKTQNEQTLHVELSRMKEEMENQRRQNEAQFLAEIRRLNERIEELQQNPNDAAVALNGGSTASGLLPEPSQNPTGASSKEFGKLLNINETLLRSTRDSGAHILSEIADLKTKLAAVTSESDISKALEEIRAAIGEAEASNASEGLAEISEAIAELKNAIEENGGASGGSIDKKLINKLSRIKSDGAEVDLTEIMRSVYELKGMLGTTDPTQKSLVNMALKVYTELDLLHATMDNAPDFKAKLEAVEKFVAQVNEQDYITSDALSAFRIVLQDIMNTPVDRSVFDAVCSFASATGKITVSSAKKEAVNKCITFCERIEREELDEILQFLPEMISALNDAEGGKNVSSNAGLYDDIIAVDTERKEGATDAIKRSAEAEIRALVSELADLRLDDVITYAPPMPLPTSDALTFSDGDSVSDRLDALTEAVGILGDTLSNMAFGGMTAEGAPAEESDEISEDGEMTATAEAGSLAGEFDKLKNMLVALNAKMNIDELIADVKNNHAAVTGRLAAIENKLASGVVSDETAAYSTVEEAPVYAADTTAQADEIVDRISERLETVLGTEAHDMADEDLAFIKEKLAEQENVVSQIFDLRADIAALSESVNGTAQFDKLYEDTVAQFDKLYEDLSAVEGDSAEKLAGELAEIKAAIEALSTNDISSAVLDGIIDLRTTYEESQALSTADREKIVEDLEFVRTQVQNWLESQTAETVRGEDLLAEMSELKETFSANILALEEKLTEASQAREADTELTKSLLSAVTERFDEMDTTAMQMAASIDEIKEKSDAIEEAISANGLLTTESQAQITDSVARILEQLTPATEEGEAPIESNFYDEIMAIAGKVEEMRVANEQSNQDILSALAEVKEQVHLKELEQSLATVSASEEEQKALLSEISELRERLSGLESAQVLQNDTIESQFAVVSDKLNEIALGMTAEEPEATSAEMEQLLGEVAAIREMLEGENSGETDSAVTEDVKTILDDLAEIKEKLSGGAGDDTDINLQLLVADVAEIKERLTAGDETSSEIVQMQDDITFIRNQIEANIETMPEDDGIAETLQSEDLSLILDDLAAIKEKLATLDEYDTVAEILSLREDVKSARILDTDDVAAELEGLKGDLLELKAELSDLGAVRADSESVVMTGAGPTSDEVNMLLGEIVSLRDEIQAYKDDVSAALSARPEGEAEPAIAVADESMSVILEELTGLHNDIDSVRGETLAEQADEIENIKAALSEIKDMISRRTTLSEDASQEGAITGELNVVLDEIINVKDEVTALKSDIAASSETVAAERESDAQAERAAFADMLQTFKNELYAMVSDKIEEANATAPDMSMELQEVRDQLADLQTLALGGAVSEEGVPSSISSELAEIKQLLAERPASAPVADEDTLQALYSEVLALRQDMEAARSAEPVMTENGTVDLAVITDQIQALREEMQALAAPAEAAPDVAVLNEILSLREELAEMREQMQAAPSVADAEADNTVLTEILSLREELATIREQMSAPAVDDTEVDHTVLNEILALREEIESLRNSRDGEDAAGLAETIEAIKADVSAIREEPDLSVVSEMLALRDEFQAFKDELNKSRTESDEAKSREELLAEVQSLRDQLFAISMANVNDGTSSEVVYESYNNIILDEIAALRDEIALIKRADETGAISEDIAQLKDKLANYVIDDGEKSDAAFAEIRGEIARLASDESTARANQAILAELAELKNELAAQREEEEVTRRAVAELADMIENRLGGSAADKNQQLLEKLDSIKTEIASSAAPSDSTEELRDEIESLRAALDRTFGEPVAIDNSAVLEEIASLRNEVRRPADTDGKRILAELAQLKKELAALADRDDKLRKDDVDDSSLSQSISDLRAELSHIAGFVDGEEPLRPAPKKPTAAGAKRGPKPKPATGTKSGTRAKPGPKPGSKRTPKKPAVKADNGLTGDELLSKIEAMSREIPEIDDGMMLNPDYVLSPDDIPPTSEEMDIAARLAKQVANKLIMEQLVQQLGDGDVTQNEVEEIVRDILPQEFTTIQIDEQTDRVRRLANSLVLDKLRSRLKK